MSSSFHQRAEIGILRSRIGAVVVESFHHLYQETTQPACGTQSVLADRYKTDLHIPPFPCHIGATRVGCLPKDRLDGMRTKGR